VTFLEINLHLDTFCYIVDCSPQAVSDTVLTLSLIVSQLSVTQYGPSMHLKFPLHRNFLSHFMCSSAKGLVISKKSILAVTLNFSCM